MTSQRTPNDSPRVHFCSTVSSGILSSPKRTDENQRRRSDHDTKSKVGEYIREMKERQETSRSRALEKRQRETSLSLEDLYLGDAPLEATSEFSPETTKRELRKSLRILKEKDMVIMSLREACQELSLKCADAENTIDEMRFRGGESSLRKSQSEMQLCPKIEKVTKNQATETTVDVLSESCSSWMEKVKYWKTESMFNTSADADSGFRESDLQEHDVPRKRPHAGPLLVPHAPAISPYSDAERSTQTTIPIAGISASTPRRSRSQTNLHWSKPVPSSANRMTIDNLQSLDLLLDEATAHARRVYKKSQRLSQLIHSVDKKV